MCCCKCCSSADDVASDFMLEGIECQCIHGDRYVLSLLSIAGQTGRLAVRLGHLLAMKLVAVHLISTLRTGKASQMNGYTGSVLRSCMFG